MQWLRVIVEGRSQPLHIKTRKKKGLILVEVIYEGEKVCSVRIGEDPPLIVVHNEEVVTVVYD